MERIVRNLDKNVRIQAVLGAYRRVKAVQSSSLLDTFPSKGCAAAFKEMPFLNERVSYFPANVTSIRKLRNLLERRQVWGRGILAGVCLWLKRVRATIKFRDVARFERAAFFHIPKPLE